MHPKERHGLRVLIKEKYRTQEIFADEIGVTDSWVSKLVRGFKNPLWENKGKDIADKLKITKKRFLELMAEGQGVDNE